MKGEIFMKKNNINYKEYEEIKKVYEHFELLTDEEVVDYINATRDIMNAYQQHVLTKEDATKMLIELKRKYKIQ